MFLHAVAEDLTGVPVPPRDGRLGDPARRLDETVPQLAKVTAVIAFQTSTLVFAPWC